MDPIKINNKNGSQYVPPEGVNFDLVADKVSQMFKGGANDSGASLNEAINYVVKNSERMGLSQEDIGYLTQPNNTAHLIQNIFQGKTGQSSSLVRNFAQQAYEKFPDLSPAQAVSSLLNEQNWGIGEYAPYIGDEVYNQVSKMSGEDAQDRAGDIASTVAGIKEEIKSDKPETETQPEPAQSEPESKYSANENFDSQSSTPTPGKQIDSPNQPVEPTQQTTAPTTLPQPQNFTYDPDNQPTPFGPAEPPKNIEEGAQQQESVVEGGTPIIVEPEQKVESDNGADESEIPEAGNPDQADGSDENLPVGGQNTDTDGDNLEQGQNDLSEIEEAGANLESTNPLDDSIKKENDLEGDIDKNNKIKPDKEGNANGDNSNDFDSKGAGGNVIKKPDKVNLSNRDSSASSKIDTTGAPGSSGALSKVSGSKISKPNTLATAATAGAGGISPTKASKIPSGGGGAASKLAKANQIKDIAQDPQAAAKQAAKDQAKRLALQAGRQLAAWIAPWVVPIIGFVFLFVTLFTAIVGTVVWAYCFEQGQIRDILEASQNVVQGDLVGAGVNVSGVGVTAKSDLRKFFEQDNGICKTINPDFCGAGNSSGSSKLTLCLNQELAGKNDDDTILFWRGNAGKVAQDGPLKVGFIKEVISAGEEAGVDSNTVAFVLSLAATESGGQEDPWKLVGGSQNAFLGVAQVGRSPELPTWSQRALGRVVSAEEFLNNPPIQMAVIQEGFQEKVGFQCAPGENSTIYEGAYAWLTCDGVDGFGTRSVDYAEAAERNFANISCQGGVENSQNTTDDTSSDDTSLLERFDRVFADYKDDDMIDLAGIVSGRVTVKAQSNIQSERERLAGLFREGKLSSQDPDDISNSLNGGFKDNLVKLMLKVYDAGFSYRGGINNGPRRAEGGHGAGEAFDFFNFQRSSTYNESDAKWVDQVNNDPEAFQIVKDAVEVMKSTNVIGGNQLIGPDSMKAQGIVFLGNTEVPGHNDHIHVQVDSTKTFDGSGASPSSSNANCQPCGNSNGSTANVGVDVSEKLSIIEQLIKDGKLTIAAQDYNLQAIKDGKVSTKNLDTVIQIASSDKFDNINLISWYRDTEFSGIPDEIYHDNNRNGRAFDIGSITKNGTVYSHLDIHSSNGPAAGIEAWVELSELMKSTGNVVQIIRDSPFTNTLRSKSGFTAASGQGSTSNIRIAEAPGHENHFHVDLDVPSKTSINNSNQNRNYANLFNGFGIQANAEFGSKPSSYSQIQSEPKHLDLLQEVADERKYIAYKDNKRESSEMRAAYDALSAKAREEGIELKLVSGYRSYDDQVGTYFSRIDKFWSDSLTPSENTEVKNAYLTRAEVSAPPGFSEHSTGLAIDIASDTAGLGASNQLEASNYPDRLTDFLEQNAPNFGFNLSYPENSTAGAGYEPWHWVFVGNDTYKNSTPLESFVIGSPSSSSQNCVSSSNSSGSDLAGGDGFIIPMSGVYFSGFYRNSGGYHGAIDIAGPTGTDVFASKDGTITTALDGCPDVGFPGSGCNGGAGNYIVIDHGDGFVTRYLHLQNGSFNVSEGDEVKQGKVLGLGASSGSSEGPHLHFEIIKNGQQQDPCNIVPCGSINGTVKAGDKK